MEYPQANGGKPPAGSWCAKHEARLDEHDARHDEHDNHFGKTLEAATAAEAQSKATHKVVTGLATGLADFATRVDQRFANLELRIVSDVATRAVQVSRDWELDEPTLSGREPEQAATVWKVRATEAETQREELAVQLAAANATIYAVDAERKRYSDHARAETTTSIEKWKLVLGFIATVVTSGAGAAALAHFF